MRLHSYYTQSFNQPLVTSLESGSQIDPDALLNPFFLSLTPGLTVPSHSNPLHKTSNQDTATAGELKDVALLCKKRTQGKAQGELEVLALINKWLT